MNRRSFIVSGSALADGLAGFFATHWQDSKSASGRARTAPDLVKLLFTNQLEVGVLSQSDAAAAARLGQDRFAKIGPVALCALAVLKDHLLVTRADLLQPIAEKILQAMQGNWGGGRSTPI